MKVLKGVFFPLRGLFTYQVCLTSGDHVFEEEGEVYQPDAEAHRHLSSHGPAAAPGQLCGTSWSPARGPTCECQGLCVNVWEPCLILPGKVHQARPLVSGSIRCQSPSSSLSLSTWPAYLYPCPALAHSEAKSRGAFFQNMAPFSLLPFTSHRHLQALEVWAPDPSATVRKVQADWIS